MESQYGDLSSEERVEVADFHTRALASVEMLWNLSWIDLSGNLEIHFFYINIHAFFISNLTCSSNFRINWIFEWIWSIPPIGVSLQDDINSLVSKIGDLPQFPAFRSQQWIKSDFVRESQMAVVVRFQHPFGWSNLWSEGIFWWSEYIEKNSWWIFGEYVCFICGSKQSKL